MTVNSRIHFFQLPVGGGNWVGGKGRGRGEGEKKATRPKGGRGGGRRTRQETFLHNGTTYDSRRKKKRMEDKRATAPPNRKIHPKGGTSTSVSLLLSSTAGNV